MKPRIQDRQPTIFAAGRPSLAPRQRARRFAAVGPSASHSINGLGIVVYDLHDVLVPYDLAWKWQKALVDRVVSRATSPTDENALGHVIVLQHSPVYTLGEGSTTKHVKFDMNMPPHPIRRIERGGEVTFHGPGQLVMYPILNLKKTAARFTLVPASTRRNAHIQSAGGFWNSGRTG
jgi:hypothetical protein